MFDAEITRIANTALEEVVAENDFSVSLKPAKNYLQLTMNENSANIKGVKIVDVSGREILSFNQDLIKDKRAVLPVENLVQGVYFIVVETEKGIW
ncbi:MAG: T9SS type A sorting domain-containing protein, partial [Bacteroidia bacterium]